ncbi:SusD/RagB family nutrient-binding outer membrane lipoprotein [Dinghuibacter silviterrae]|uniref:SusD-like starch-binding protein associating with outer membrane n=1 Tax=Dinghuibacter silviterrae TaxID=1539049 RepID=A0A4R8DSJ5_9BACT|nr:SusD/RagB family nutrient-binding outer membrane lipoprotein [Dinghuibacter silviterrae]TDX00828.1 SusD-like starch-binding protein associating with outer membrane [Dinghuibacter silviterrae]
MKKNILSYTGLALALACAGLSGCQKGDLLSNPNVASTATTVPPSLILNRITNELYNGGGVMDGVNGNASEIPFSQVQRWNQFFVSNFAYYWGNNSYNWSNTATMYSVLKYTELMEQQVAKQYGSTTTYYSALAKFFRAYNFIWYTQRVGDIPMSEAGDANNTTPKYDLQHDVYKNCLALLDTANTLMASVVTPANQNNTMDATGDIYGLTYLQWQKVINTYKLRVLISLSKRAADNADLNITQQFAAIVTNPTKYPIMTSNADNMTYKYNAAYNKYPISPNYTPYNFFEDVCNTYLNITTADQDPRTFIAASPAPAQFYGQHKALGDFTAYVGADIDLSEGDINNNSVAGQYSYTNYARYYSDPTGATEEPYILVGYPELCFNIAEAANRGWLSGVSGLTWYNNGIAASLAMYKLADGVQIPEADSAGNSLGSVTANVTAFLANPNVVYAGDNAAGLKQILTQKYVAFWQNSGWEAFYNWRRTGVPTFGQGGPGIGTTSSGNLIPLRWQYPLDEANYNSTNYQSAIQSQYGGTDDITKPMWLIK